MTDAAVLDSPEAIDAHLTKAIGPWERRRHGVRFVLCGSGNQVRAHCPVDHLPPVAAPGDAAQTVSVFARALAESDRDGGMLVVITRPGSAAVSDGDRVWFHTAHNICTKLGVRLLGVHLMTPADQRPIQLDDAL